ncbi:MAG: GGDEF domain-containing protein [Georgfuchsia sp.]
MSDREQSKNIGHTSLVQFWRSIALPVAIVLFSVEVQRHWGKSAGWAYLCADLMLVVVWSGTLLGYKRADRISGVVIDLALFFLLLCGVFLPYLSDGRVGPEILRSILFWAPAICGWWALSYYDNFYRVVINAALLYAGLYFLDYPDSERHFYEYALIGIMIIGLGRLIARGMLSKFKQDIKKLHAITFDASMRDPVTGVASKMYFEAELSHMVAVANRYQFPFSMAICSIDEFERYKEKYGEDAANDLLKAVSWQIVERIRTSDTVCHWKENEFAILLSGTVGQDAVKVAENIRMSIHSIPNVGKNEVLLQVAFCEHKSGEDPMAIFDTIYRYLEQSKHGTCNQQIAPATTPENKC